MTSDKYFQMIKHAETDDRTLRSLIRAGKVRFGGNRRLKIYGMLQCASGKRMKRANRVFFGSEKLALESGYRPCGHCMRGAYRAWKRYHL